MESPEYLDEVCGICRKTRDLHGDMNHKFSVEGDLIPVEKRPEPRMKSPDAEAPKTPLDRAFATLMEVLVEKELINAKEVIRIFSGIG